MSHYRHVIWDWNGTLFNDTWLGVEVINLTLTNRNMDPISEGQYRELFGFPVKDYYVRLGFDFEKESFEEVGTEWVMEYERRREEVNLHANARNVLAGLQARGIGQSILSAYKQQTLDELIKHFDLQSFFMGVNGLDNHYATSKEEIGRRWIESLDHSGDEVVLVGDTEHDFDVAQAMGVDCVLIPNGHQSAHKLERTGARMFASLGEMGRELFGLQNIEQGMQNSE